ncbi:hypothetical protein SUGI_0356730 [Cryptomeria japonica]|nr:hypothetical protein SUGI_0356730 [Cryptomeria japonica]
MKVPVEEFIDCKDVVESVFTMLEDRRNSSKELPNVAVLKPLREPDGYIMAQVKSVFVDELPQFWDED